MLRQKDFERLDHHFSESEELVEIAELSRPHLDFVCHHSSYLVAKYLQECGHNCRWVNGYYRCNGPNPTVHHSWVAVNRNGAPIAILEFDPRQIHKRGGYSDDPMPTPDDDHPNTGIAIIIDPEHVELPDDRIDSRWIVQSKDVLSRYVQDNTRLPKDIDFDDLDEVFAEALNELEERKRQDDEDAVETRLGRQ